MSFVLNLQSDNDRDMCTRQQCIDRLTGQSDDGLIEMLNGSIHMQMFCGVLIDPAKPLKNGKIVSAIRQRIARLTYAKHRKHTRAATAKPRLRLLGLLSKQIGQWNRTHC